MSHIPIHPAELRVLKTHLHGQLIVPGDDAYWPGHVLAKPPDPRVQLFRLSR